MNLKTLHRAVASAIIAGGALAATSASASTWSIIELGHFDPGVISEGLGVNDHGQVTGRATTLPANGRGTTFLYDDSGLHNLGPADGKGESQGNAINNAGIIAGQAYPTVASTLRAMRYGTDGSVSDLGTLKADNSGSSVANDINNAGTIVGRAASDANTRTHAVIWNVDGTKTAIGTFANGRSSNAYGINELGQVTGAAERRYISGGTTRYVSQAYLYDSDTHSKINLGSFIQNGWSTGYSINDSGWVVGAAQVDTTPNSSGITPGQAFLYTGGGLIDLGIGSTLGAATSAAYDINNLGQVVGNYKLVDQATARSFAFLYANGEVIDLNTLLASDSGWDLREAHGINEFGQIVGTGLYTDEASGLTYARAFLMTAPIPEPAEWALMLAGLGVVGTIARRRKQLQAA
jgi:probable HAF family extracellular repeat protein